MAAAAPARSRPQRAAPPPAPRSPRVQSRRARDRARPRVAGGVVWIALVAVLLGGIVALNVAALRLNLEAQRLEERKQQLVGENAATASELSGLASAGRIEEVARRDLGLVEATDARYVRVRGRR